MRAAEQFGLFQISLQTPARARRADPPTSKLAAADVHVEELEDRVLRALRLSRTAARGSNLHGMTTHELAWLLKVELVSISPRLKPLADKGLVEDSGERRRGDSGRNSIVWRAI